MADEAQGQAQAGQGAESQTAPSIPVDEIVKQAIEKATEISRKEIAGLNKANSELQKKIEMAELEKLSEKERAQKEVEIAKAEREKIESEANALKRGIIAHKVLSELNLPLEFEQRIIGQSEDEIKADAKRFNDFIEGLVKTRVEQKINAALGGKAPESGQPADMNTLQGAYEKAKSANDMPQMLAIKRRAQKDGITLKE